MGNFSQYEVALVTLAQGKYEQDFVCDDEFFAGFDNGDILEQSRVDAHLTIEHKNGVYNCLLQFEGELQIACDRCLEAMPHAVSMRYEFTIKYGEEYDDTIEGVIVLPQNERKYNFAQDLYESIVLTIPIRHIHNEGECNEQMRQMLRQHSVESDDEDESDND